MSEAFEPEGSGRMVRNIVLVVAGIYIIVSIILLIQAFSRIDELERKQSAKQDEMMKKIDDSISQNRASIDALAERVGATRQDLAKRAAAILRDEKAISSRVTEGEEQTKRHFGEVSGAVDGVKSDVGKVKDELTATRSDLDATRNKLEHAIGDISKESELIATTHDELEVLKHRGDRNYYEFTLTKGKDTTHVGTIGLQLKKVDSKKSQFTIYVIADDKKIEKKDKTINEPLQFYSGRDHNLFEVVVNSVDKNKVTGYLATPKTVATGLVGTQN